MAQEREKILITGAAGFLGSRLVEALKDKHEVIAAIHHAPLPVAGVETVKVDFMDIDTYEDLIINLMPSVLIHCAAFSTIEQCEENEDDAMAINDDAAEQLFETLSEEGGYGILISTDLVFDGKKGFYIDTASTQPLPKHVFGKTMAEAEGLVDPLAHLVLRTPLLYGAGLSEKKSFFEHLVSELKVGRQVRCFKDQFRTPLSLGQMGRILEKLVVTKPRGLFNVAGDERVSRYEFAQRVAHLAGLNQDLVEAASQSEHPLGKLMPKDVSLKMKGLLGPLKGLDLSLDAGIAEELARMG